MAGILQLLDDLCNVIVCVRQALIFKQPSCEFTMYALKLLQMGCGRCVAAPCCFNSFKNEIGCTRHRGNHHHNPVMFGSIADDGGALAEPLRISYGGTAKLHYDQALSVHYGFSSFCNTAPILSMRGISSRVTAAPLLSASVNVASACTPSLPRILCNSSATRISSPVVKAITEEPDPLIATPSNPGRRRAKHRSIPGTSCCR